MIEKRSAPRYPCQSQLTIWGVDQHSHSAQAFDISQVGISFQISYSEMLNLFNEGIHLDVGDHFQLSINPHQNEYLKVNFNCLVKQVRRLSQDRYHVAVWFTDIKANQQRLIKHLIKEAKNAEIA